MNTSLIFSLISCIIAIIGSVLGIATFASNRKDKAVEDAKETNMGLINYRLNELAEKVDKILTKLDYYDNEIDKKIEKAMEQHIFMYHKGE